MKRLDDYPVRIRLAQSDDGHLHHAEYSVDTTKLKWYDIRRLVCFWHIVWLFDSTQPLSWHLKYRDDDIMHFVGWEPSQEEVDEFNAAGMTVAEFEDLVRQRNNLATTMTYSMSVAPPEEVSRLILKLDTESCGE